MRKAELLNRRLGLFSENGWGGAHRSLHFCEASIVKNLGEKKARTAKSGDLISKSDNVARSFTASADKICAIYRVSRQMFRALVLPE